LHFFVRSILGHAFEDAVTVVASVVDDGLGLMHQGGAYGLRLLRAEQTSGDVEASLIKLLELLFGRGSCVHFHFLSNRIDPVLIPSLRYSRFRAWPL